MTKFKKAISQSHDEWQEKMDNMASSADAEEIKESADRVWAKIKLEMGVKE